MAELRQEAVEAPVRGGLLWASRWGEEGAPVLAIHGITGSHASWWSVAERLAGQAQVIAPDLRGRGASGRLPGPYGMATHVEDCLSLMDHLGIGRAVVAGHSMGGYVAALMAARYPQRVSAVLLVDGGIPLPVPENVDVQAHLDAVLGPSIQRLRLTFESRQAYLDFWRQHPGVGPYWNDYIQRYLEYDLEGEPPALRSRVREEAVREDGADLLVNPEVRGCLAQVRCQLLLLRAPRGLLDQPQPLISDEAVAHWRSVQPRLEEETVPGVNHYTIVLAPEGADVVAARLRSLLASA